MNKHYFILFFIFFIITCCKDYSPITGDKDSVSYPFYPVIMIEDHLKFNRIDWPSGYYFINNLQIDADTLTVNLEMFDFVDSTLNLVFWLYFLESNPVQAYAIISLSEKDTSQNEVRETNIRFDLTPLKEEYFSFYSAWKSGPNQIITIAIIDSLYLPSPGIRINYRL